MQTYLKSRPVGIQLLLFIGMAVGSFYVIFFVGTMILSNMTGLNLLQIQDKWDVQNPNMIVFLRGLLLLQFLGLFLVPSLLFAYFSDPRPQQYLGMQKPHSNLYWLLGIGIILVSAPVTEALGLLNQKMVFGDSTQKWMKAMEEEAGKTSKFMLAQKSPFQLALNLLFIAVFAGVGEELFFRGVLQRLFIRLTRNPWIGIFVTAVLFSGFHFQFFGFLPRLFLGVLLGAIYWYSGSLWPAILAHIFYNGLIVVLVYFNPQLATEETSRIIPAAQMIVATVISAVLVYYLIYLMKKKSQTDFNKIYHDDFVQTDQTSY